ncbi:hypothetical protein LINGRAHAP2_LOCUS7313, partial [Linum grandiflorum]
ELPGTTWRCLTSTRCLIVRGSRIIVRVPGMKLRGRECSVSRKSKELVGSSLRVTALILWWQLTG